jgi:hypothetical protein
MPGLTRVVLAVTVASILILGVYPNWIHRMASKGWPHREYLEEFGLSDAPTRIR